MRGQVSQFLLMTKRRLSAAGKSSRRIKFKRAPRPASTIPAETKYALALTSMIKTGGRLVEDIILSQLDRLIRIGQVKADSDRRNDAGWPDELARMVGDFRQRFERETGSRFEQALQEAESETNGKNMRSFQNQMKKMLQIDVFSQDPDLPFALKAWENENRRLWKNVGEQMIGDVEGIVSREMAAGARRETIAEKIMNRLGVSESRARVIAVDQVQKLQGELTRRRQVQSGVSHYKWRTSLDERVRPAHAEREDVVFSWDSPPEDGHPGQPINCRCWAEPYLEDLI